MQEYKYTVIQPGKLTREFDTSKDAIEFLVSHHGFSKLYAPDGRLLMTKGMPRQGD